ncbi:hypothetical protein [Paracoccus versutus]|uniref:hypothetical protein n=1 Tax=Paracoccus versutus TaxID=34007 RepID=UPI000DF7E378|nr:hypothetical protein [Paracoccus versutus]RDD69669.1 hypothetical protein DVR11_20350 [Paracoccus versutus]
MQHEVMRQPAPGPGSDNVGDVLASIRRLIAQDGAGCRIPDQALNAPPAQDEAPPAQTAPLPRPASSARITPLVLDSSILVAAEPVNDPQAGIPPEPRIFGDWLRMPPAEEPAAPEARAGRVDAAEAAADHADIEATIQPPGPSPEAPTTTILQMEETMLHANASVTPINPAAEAQAAEALARDTGEPHLFAPQDKDAQKGTHLRGMIREAIRQELQGEIGNRLSRNLQQMIRHEIELALRQMCEED